MFTGIVQGKGILISSKCYKDFKTYKIKFPYNLIKGLKKGYSVANNGCCLSVTCINKNIVSFDLVKETLLSTNLGSLHVGDEINLERAVKYGSEIGGHIMSGHIMTLAAVYKVVKKEKNIQMLFKLLKDDYCKFIVHKGFIGIDGISLTLGNIDYDVFSVNLIPETVENTNILNRNVGDIVNIEIDYYVYLFFKNFKKILYYNN